MLESVHSFLPQAHSRPRFQGHSGVLPRAESAIQSRRSETIQQGASSISAPQSIKSEPLSADRAAGNILLFIENQLKQDVASGDSAEKLQSRFDAGLKGFLEGFNDAKNQLSEMGLLQGDLADEIGSTFTKVTEGLKQLANELGLDSSAVPAAATDEQAKSVDTQRTEFAFAAGESRKSVIKAHKSFEFTLQTQEGDRVKISASSQFSAKSFESAQGSGARTGQSQQFNFQVDGDLNAEELSAINDLLNQVNNLSDQFFEGDLDGAFEAALGLGFDADEIASFALDLKYSVVQKVRTTYGQTPSEVSPFRNQLQPFAQLADQIQSALDSAKKFLQPVALLDSLLTDRLETPSKLSAVDGGVGNLHKLFGDVNHALAEKLDVA